jgi:transporter family protein
MSIVVSIAFSYFIFREKLSRRALIGLLLMVAGTLLMVLAGK